VDQGSVETVVELVTTTVLVTDDAGGLVYVVDVDDVAGVDVTVVVSDDVVDEIVLAVDDISLVVEGVSDVVLVELAVGVRDVEVDAESVESVDIEEEEAVDSVEVVTASVVDVADVDSVGMVDSCELVDDSVKVELSFRWIVTALVVEALKISPNMDKETTMRRVTRTLLDIHRSLFIAPFFIRCLHLTMSCSWRISEVDESSLPLLVIRNLFPAWKHRKLITVTAGR